MTKKRKRLGQIMRWLELEFPTIYPVRLRVEKMPKEYKDCHGTYHCPTERCKAALIRLNKKDSLSTQIETLLHEWAHARTDPDSLSSERKHGGHVNRFYLEFGRIERTFLTAIEGVLKPK
tara:strand:+ start:62 stop:421 length:360 start_codon:yes stop_codon:yes gene_type:complete